MSQIPTTHDIFIVTVTFSSSIVPLSAYAVQQHFMNNPNDTNCIPSYFNMLPSFLRRSPGDFAPHIFTTGDTFRTNFSIFGPYTIHNVYARIDSNIPADSPGLGESLVPVAVHTVPSFLYKNHDLSSCDVASITLDLDFSFNPDWQIRGSVAAMVRHGQPSIYLAI